MNAVDSVTHAKLSLVDDLFEELRFGTTDGSQHPRPIATKQDHFQRPLERLLVLERRFMCTQQSRLVTPPACQMAQAEKVEKHVSLALFLGLYCAAGLNSLVPFPFVWSSTSPSLALIN